MYKTCHTEESSRRQRELEQGLLSAMGTQPYVKIQLTDLCRNLKIPRKTFYRYFPSKEDCLLALIDHTLSDCNDIALGGWDGGAELDQRALLRFFQYWKAHSCFLDAVGENKLYGLLMDRTTVIVDRMKAGRTERSFACDQLEYFVAHGLMTTVLRWHRFGFRSSPEEMAEVFSKLLLSPDISITRLML